MSVMKGYCTAADVRLALAPLEDYNEVATAAKMTDKQINDAISEAEGVVDSYLLVRYTIPLTEVEDDSDPMNVLIYFVAPAPVRGITRTIAAYLATLTWRKSKDMGEDDPIRLRYGVALDMLAAVRSRNADLPPEFPPNEDDNQGISVYNLYEGTLFAPEDVGIVSVGRANAQILLPAVGYWP